ncbi:hypothetical protein P7K49_019315 [Saguinus oedipus]|uniref:Uncharacterized protein n=1 Tax=Saguinus oedipus TaxID=9490 RepID=A0ABQ9UXZ3_SAGOE|nr:hypothetical protein P7K49_019315 [Saguinus oedipus]
MHKTGLQDASQAAHVWRLHTTVQDWPTSVEVKGETKQPHFSHSNTRLEERAGFEKKRTQQERCCDRL